MNTIPHRIPDNSEYKHIDTLREKNIKPREDRDIESPEIFPNSKKIVFLSSEKNSFYADLASFVYTQLSATIKKDIHTKSETRFIEKTEKNSDIDELLQKKLKKNMNERVLAKYIWEQIGKKHIQNTSKAKNISENDFKKANEVIVIIGDKNDFEDIKSMEIVSVLENKYAEKIRTRSFDNNSDIKEIFNGIWTLVEWLIEKDIETSLVWYNDEEKEKIKKEIHKTIKETFGSTIWKKIKDIINHKKIEKEIFETLKKK